MGRAKRETPAVGIDGFDAAFGTRRGALAANNQTLSSLLTTISDERSFDEVTSRIKAGKVQAGEYDSIIYSLLKLQEVEDVLHSNPDFFPALADQAEKGSKHAAASIHLLLQGESLSKETIAPFRPGYKRLLENQYIRGALLPKLDEDGLDLVARDPKRFHGVHFMIASGWEAGDLTSEQAAMHMLPRTGGRLPEDYRDLLDAWAKSDLNALGDRAKEVNRMASWFRQGAITPDHAAYSLMLRYAKEVETGSEEIVLAASNDYSMTIRGDNSEGREVISQALVNHLTPEKVTRDILHMALYDTSFAGIPDSSKSAAKHSLATLSALTKNYEGIEDSLVAQDVDSKAGDIRTMVVGELKTFANQKEQKDFEPMKAFKEAIADSSVRSAQRAMAKLYLQTLGFVPQNDISDMNARNKIVYLTAIESVGSERDSSAVERAALIATHHNLVSQMVPQFLVHGHKFLGVSKEDAKHLDANDWIAALTYIQGNPSHGMMTMDDELEMSAVNVEKLQRTLNAFLINRRGY